MTVANWIGILVPVFAVIGAAFLYVFQRRIDRREIIRGEKKKAYQEFLNALFEHAEHRTAETRKAYDKSKIALVLVAPDAIVKEVVGVQEMATMDMDATGPGDVHATVIGLIVEMRKDCFADTNLVASELEYIVPIGKPTPLTAEPEGHFEP